jgi:hypothetical protein
MTPACGVGLGWRDDEQQEPRSMRHAQFAWHEIEVRLNQIAAAPGLDQELCRSEVERRRSKQERIEFISRLRPPRGCRVAKMVRNGVIARR